MRKHIHWATLFAIGTVAFGCVYAVYLGNQLRYPDEQDYYRLALNLIRTHRYTLDGSLPTTYRAPGYPLLLAMLAAVGASIPVLRVANFLALGLSIYCVDGLLKRHAAPTAALVGSALVCCYPVLFYTAGTLYPQTIAACIFLAILQHLSTRPNLTRTLIAGSLCGLLLLTVPAFAMPLIVLLLWWGHRVPKRYLGGLLLVAAIPVGSWIARDLAVFHRFVFVTSNTGENLLLGNSEYTTANGGVNVDISRYRAVGAGLGEIDRDGYYRSQAVAYIAHHPRRSTVIYLRKFANYFNFENELYVTSQASSRNNIIMLLSYGLLLLVVAMRLLCVKLIKLSSWEKLLLLLYLVNAGWSALFFTRIRLRLPFDFLLIMLAAIALNHLGRLVWGGTRLSTSNTTNVPAT